MALVDWRVKGPELAACNCNWGCPCQFNGLPSHGDCRAAVAMRIDEGHFADISLSGLTWAGLFAWPGAIHEGNGEALPIVDERADERQRQALLTILSGKEAEPGSGVFNVFMSTMTKVHPPVFAPIAFKADKKRRTGTFSVAGIVEAKGEPIRNLATGAEQEVSVVMPGGFEFLEAEFASSTVTAKGAIPLDWEGRHAHFATLDIGPRGPFH
ncbi:MAG: DUF1326 domain-containing protein [Caulobacteraceae bacterium]